MIATYRLQLTPEFTFTDAAAVMSYLQRLGISHVYLSPITEAVAGSTHGYDVEDHNAIRQELGGEEGWNRLLNSVRNASLKLILDFVPNHAGVGPTNEAWQSVLRYGQHSPFADYFDIDWNPLEKSLDGKVLLPFLGRPYGACLDDGEIQLVWQGDSLRAAYGDQSYSLSPQTYPPLILQAMEQHERCDLYFDLKSIRDGFLALVPHDVPRAEMLLQRLKSLAGRIDWELALKEFHGERLHSLLEQQHWRLAFWKAASYETNYRRFFDVNGLVALRVQDSHVFWSAHRLLSTLAAQPEVDGVRIDHIDGLADPQAYLERLRELGVRHVWVEKVLAPGEIIPSEWSTDGTTGYEFMNDVMHVLIDSSGVESIVRTYQRFVGDNSTFQETTREGKRLVMETSLSSELHRLAHELNNLSKADYHTRDFAMGALREALAELIAAIDRYRTYLPYDQEVASKVIQSAIQRASRQSAAFEPTMYQFIADVLCGRVSPQLLGKQQRWLERFQQYCSAVAAKGVEDTSFYRYIPLLALNEVGGTPQLGPQPLQAFHSHAKFRAKFYPHNLLATATHDHKRGEDTRMRLIALSLVPELWEETLRELEKFVETCTSLTGPTKHDRYLFFQVLVAIWCEHESGDLPQRLVDYVLKAARESKQQTSWNHPNPEYEQSLADFATAVLEHPRLADAIGPLNAQLSRLGFFNSLSQSLLKMLSPGIPDFYQGCELLDLSLVDPDNRRPVDYRWRWELLEKLQSVLNKPSAATIQQWIEDCDESVKLYVIARLLRLRQEMGAVFESDVYQEVNLTGEGSDDWVAFIRSGEGGAAMTVVPRCRALVVDPGPIQISLEEPLRQRSWREYLTDTPVELSETLELRHLPLRWSVFVSQ